MDNRIIGGIAVLGLALVVGVGAFVMMGDDGDAPEPTEQAATPDAKGKTPTAKVDGRPDPSPDAAVDDQAVKDAGDQPTDDDWEERAQKHRENREAKNLQWRNESTAAAQEWVANSGIDEAQGLQVMSAVTKFHDTIAQSRADLEDGIIDPKTLREELEMAREDIRVELENVLGPEKKEQFLKATRKDRLGGF